MAFDTVHGESGESSKIIFGYGVAPFADGWCNARTVEEVDERLDGLDLVCTEAVLHP